MSLISKHLLYRYRDISIQPRVVKGSFPLRELSVHSLFFAVVTLCSRELVFTEDSRIANRVLHVLSSFSSSSSSSSYRTMSCILFKYSACPPVTFMSNSLINVLQACYHPSYLHDFSVHVSWFFVHLLTSSISRILRMLRILSCRVMSVMQIPNMLISVVLSRRLMMLSFLFQWRRSREFYVSSSCSLSSQVLSPMSIALLRIINSDRMRISPVTEMLFEYPQDADESMLHLVLPRSSIASTWRDASIDTRSGAIRTVHRDHDEHARLRPPNCRIARRLSRRNAEARIDVKQKQSPSAFS